MGPIHRKSEVQHSNHRGLRHPTPGSLPHGPHAWQPDSEQRPGPSRQNCKLRTHLLMPQEKPGSPHRVGLGTAREVLSQRHLARVQQYPPGRSPAVPPCPPGMVLEGLPTAVTVRQSVPPSTCTKELVPVPSLWLYLPATTAH